MKVWSSRQEGGLGLKRLPTKTSLSCSKKKKWQKKKTKKTIQVLQDSWGSPIVSVMSECQGVEEDQELNKSVKLLNDCPCFRFCICRVTRQNTRQGVSHPLFKDTTVFPLGVVVPPRPRPLPLWSSDWLGWWKVQYCRVSCSTNERLPDGKQSCYSQNIPGLSYSTCVDWKLGLVLQGHCRYTCTETADPRSAGL